MPLTRAQRWSHVAYTKVRSIKDAEPDSIDKYRTSCNKMPGLIHQSGSLQALVFQVARDKTGATYVNHLAAAYFETSGGAVKTYVDLIQHAQGLELSAYMAFTRDLADIAQWFRRFAQVELDDSKRASPVTPSEQRVAARTPDADA